MAALVSFPSAQAAVGVALTCLQLVGFPPSLCCVSLLLGQPDGDAGLDARHGGSCLVRGMLSSCNYSGAFCSVTWKRFDPFGHPRDLWAGPEQHLVQSSVFPLKKRGAPSLCLAVLKAEPGEATALCSSAAHSLHAAPRFSRLARCASLLSTAYHAP